MTCDRDIAADVAAFFNLLTGYSEAVGWSKLTIAPDRLKQRFIDLIEREIQVSTPDRPGLIMAKVNSLQDREICRALYRASQAGVKVLLNVRGICCLRPGVKGVSENIEVRSIVDRFLEHARIFYFRNGGHEEVYLQQRRLDAPQPRASGWRSSSRSSTPNLRRRLIDDPRDLLRRQREGPPTAARRHLRAGRSQSRKPVRAQEKFYREAVEAVRAAEQATLRFRPLKNPEADE